MPAGLDAERVHARGRPQSHCNWICGDGEWGLRCADEVDALLGRRREGEHEAMTALKTEVMQLWDGCPPPRPLPSSQQESVVYLAGVPFQFPNFQNTSLRT